ncbi:MAG: hypothetical protein ACJ0QL_03180 [Parvicellaceae bacterium]
MSFPTNFVETSLKIITVKGLIAIDEIKKKFQVLIKENQELANQNQSMKDQLNSINANEQNMVNEINELKEKYKILKMSKKLDGQETENSTELKLKINEMVKEIDKCIALLNK